VANTLEIVIKATDKASKEIGAVTKGIDGLGKAGGAIFKTVSIAAAAAATAVGAVGAAIVKLAVDAVPLQGIEAAFQGITEGSAEMLDALRASSNGMVRDTELMKSYNLAAQLVGKEFADKLPDAMGYLQKVAAATGQDMSYMMDSLVRGVGRMSPMILDNLGIQVTLEEATAEAAAMFGVEASELTKVQLQAGMTNVVMRALERNTATMPEVAGSAAQQWAAFNTQLANFKDRIGMGALPILQRLLGTVEDAGLGGWLDKISGWFGESFVPGLLNVWDRVAQFIEDMQNGERIETAVRKMLQGLFSEDTVDRAIDVVHFVAGVARAIGRGDWQSAGTMLWDKVVEAFEGAVSMGKRADEILRDWISGKLGIKAELKLDPGMEGLPSDVLAGMMPNTSTWGEIGLEIWRQVQQGFQDGVTAAWDYATNLEETLRNGLSDALGLSGTAQFNDVGAGQAQTSGWSAIGVEIMQRIKAGMLSAQVWTGGFLDIIKGKVADELGIGSGGYSDVGAGAVDPTWGAIGEGIGARIIAGLRAYNDSSPSGAEISKAIVENAVTEQNKQDYYDLGYKIADAMLNSGGFGDGIKAYFKDKFVGDLEDAFWQAIGWTPGATGFLASARQVYEVGRGYMARTNEEPNTNILQNVMTAGQQAAAESSAITSAATTVSFLDRVTLWWDEHTTGLYTPLADLTNNLNAAAAAAERFRKYADSPTVNSEENYGPSRNPVLSGLRQAGVPY
jgi:hypothetical protein